MIGFIGCFYSVTINSDSSQSLTVHDSLRSLLDHSFFSSTATSDERRIPAHTLNWLVGRFPHEWINELSLSLMLRPTVSRPVCLGMKHTSGACDQIYITVRQLRVCWCGALSLTRGRVCRLQLLMALASALILGYESHGTRERILLSQIRNFRLRRLLRLTNTRLLKRSIPSNRSSIVDCVRNVFT
jgi:hypothetical protein